MSDQVYPPINNRRLIDALWNYYNMQAQLLMYMFEHVHVLTAIKLDTPIELLATRSLTDMKPVETNVRASD